MLEDVRGEVYTLNQKYSPVMKPKNRVESCNWGVTHMTATIVRVSASSEDLVQVRRCFRKRLIKNGRVFVRTRDATHVDVIVNVLQRQIVRVWMLLVVFGRGKELPRFEVVRSKQSVNEFSDRSSIACVPHRVL